MTTAIGIQVFFGMLGAVNVYVAFMLNRKAKAHDMHMEKHEQIDNRLNVIERDVMPEERFRRIIREELTAWELRLMKEGRFYNDNR